MARFPFFGFPYQYPYYNRYYNNYKYYNSNINKNNNNANDTDKEIEESSVQARDNNNLDRFNSKIPSKNNQFLPFSFNFTGFSDCDKPILEIMGIKLFLDDIIILGILFLLYKEEVKDEMLFIALILLLLS
mgnify:FL=1